MFNNLTFLEWASLGWIGASECTVRLTSYKRTLIFVLSGLLGEAALNSSLGLVPRKVSFNLLPGAKRPSVLVAFLLL